jgi:hypothetical protein
MQLEDTQWFSTLNVLHRLLSLLEEFNAKPQGLQMPVSSYSNIIAAFEKTLKVHQRDLIGLILPTYF